MYFDMSTFQRLQTGLAVLSAGIFFLSTPGYAQEGGTMSAAELAGRMNALRQDSAYVRMKLDTAGGTLQLEGKERRGRGGAEVVYRVLFPRERKGEALLLRSGGGTRFVPPNTLQPIGAGQMDEAFFGSALANADLVENFFAWPQQAIVGTDSVNRVNCQVLESKPGKGGSIYGSVKSWIDTRRFVPLRVEKYSSAGKLVRRVDTTKVATDDRRRSIPANLSIQGPGGVTSELDGSKIKHDVTFADREFTPEGLKEDVGARAGAE
jgi:Outer membrane lipoprotein-sorting protein